MTNYRRGSDAERRVRTRLEAIGYFVIRSAGSKTPVDLVAFKRGQKPLFVQVKYGKRGLPPSERIKLMDLAGDNDASPVVVTRGLRFEWLDAA